MSDSSERTKLDDWERHVLAQIANTLRSILIVSYVSFIFLCFLIVAVILTGDK